MMEPCSKAHPWGCVRDSGGWVGMFLAVFPFPPLFRPLAVVQARTLGYVCFKFKK